MVNGEIQMASEHMETSTVSRAIGRVNGVCLTIEQQGRQCADCVSVRAGAVLLQPVEVVCIGNPLEGIVVIQSLRAQVPWSKDNGDR